MKTTVLRKMAYENTFIYILQYNYTFQYLFGWNNEVYRQEIILRPGLLRRVAWRFGILRSPYTREHLDQGEQIILSGAMKSIDLLKQDKSGSKRRRAERAAKTSHSKCQWQARTDKNGNPIYFCFVHNQVAPFTKNPSHN